MATRIEQSLKILDYSLSKVPTSISGIRLMDSAVKLAALYDIKEVKGFDLQLLGATAKTLDSISYIPKFIESAEKFVITIRNFDTANKTESVVKIIFSTFKVVGDAAASMRFFIVMGASLYVSKTTAGYIKNSLSVIAAAKFFFDAATADGSKGGKKKTSSEIVARSASMWLNGMGAIVEWVGADVLAASGKTQIPAPMWPIMGMIASVATIVNDYKG